MNKYFLLFLCFLPAMGFTYNDHEFFKLRRAQRQVKAHTIKSAVAHYDEKKQIPDQQKNGDEKRYSDLRGSFGKALDHHTNGYIDKSAFASLICALNSGDPKDFNKIKLGFGIFKLVNPQGAFAYSLCGNDAWINSICPAPCFASAETAGEMVELYWTVLCRDIPFNEFDTNGLVMNAVDDLNTLSCFKGPRDANGDVTPETFLRGNAPGELVGPYISQFLYQTIPYGSSEILPGQSVPLSGSDFMISFTDWFQVINGGTPNGMVTKEDVPFIRTPRDLAEYVHNDFPGQAACNAAFLLNSFGADALDPCNPYRDNPTQVGFVTFGISDALCLVREAIHEGLKAAWYHKWIVNRRLRPEEYGFYVYQQKCMNIPLGISSELIDSPVLNMFPMCFLPQAYPEGSPTHPSYPAGHATLIGAAVTMLKAFYNEDFVIPNPLMPDMVNMNLIAYGGDLTVGGELNKLASNISLGRDHAGVHYRSDGWQGMLLGEKVAIDILNSHSYLYNENFKGFTLTKFDGTTIRVGGKG